jgi:hypothetical protein
MANIWPGRQANGSTITTAGGDTSAGQLVAYAFWDRALSTKFPVKFALINMQIFNITQNITRPEVTFDISAYLPKRSSIVSVRRLQAPGADIKDGNQTFWAGQEYSTGLAVGKKRVETIRGGKIVLPASEAALVQVL